MLSERRYSLREDVLVETDPATGSLVVFSSSGEVHLGKVSPKVASVLQRMTLGPVSLENALPAAGQQMQAKSEIDGVLDELCDCVVQSLGADGTGRLLLSAIPLERRSRLQIDQIKPDRPVRLSRFAALRACADDLWLESPLSSHRVVLHVPLAGWVVSSLSSPITIPELTELIPAPAGLVADVVAYLVAVGMVLVAEDPLPATPRFAEDSHPHLVHWPYHELMFHARSRMGRQDTPFGIAALYQHRVTMGPVVRPIPSGPRYELPRPDLGKLQTTDPRLVELVEVGAAGQDPTLTELSSQQIGELLFRTARVRSTWPAAEGGLEYELSDRPYPSSSQLYELELYLTLDRCSGLPPGSYHYDPVEHALTLINTSRNQIGDLLDEARVAVGAMRRPALLITITARIGRLSRHYCSVAYSTALRHAGILQGNLHLTATAMGLAPATSALDNGDATSRALHLEWPAEVNVADFLLGVQLPSWR